MFKELKLIFFISTILLFIFLTGKYYFSDENKKKIFRNMSNHNDKIIDYSKDIVQLKNNTNKIIQYVNDENNNNNKKYFFWDLLKND